MGRFSAILKLFFTKPQNLTSQQKLKTRLAKVYAISSWSVVGLLLFNFLRTKNREDEPAANDPAILEHHSNLDDDEVLEKRRNVYTYTSTTDLKKYPTLYSHYMKRFETLQDSSSEEIESSIEE